VRRCSASINENETLYRGAFSATSGSRRTHHVYSQQVMKAQSHVCATRSGHISYKFPREGVSNPQEELLRTRDVILKQPCRPFLQCLLLPEVRHIPAVCNSMRLGTVPCPHYELPRFLQTRRNLKGLEWGTQCGGYSRCTATLETNMFRVHPQDDQGEKVTREEGNGWYCIVKASGLGLLVTGKL
jgi:hypothetical protein